MNITRVLIVDDEAGYRIALEEILEQEGYAVETAENGKDAIEASGRTPPDVLIADWKLNGQLSGIDVALALGVSNPRLQTVFITGRSAEELRADTHDLDEFKVLEKPFNTDDLLEMIHGISRM